jgi:hypothetical protein
MLNCRPCHGAEGNSIAVSSTSGPEQRFEFDSVFSPHHDQASVYSGVVRGMVYDVTEGYNW